MTQIRMMTSSPPIKKEEISGNKVRNISDILKYRFRMYFNKKYQERASAQSEFEKEIEQGIDNRIQADHEDSSNHDDYGGPQHTQQEFYDLNEELERFE